jgi:signal transduction histidine kinase
MELSELKSEFVSNVSHELRTPLTSIRMYADMLHEGRARTPERRQRYVETIAREAERLERLIDGILEFHRHEAGRKEYELEQLQPGEVALEALSEVRSRLQAARFEVAVAVDDALPFVEADRKSLVTAIRNLLVNAIKYSSSERRVVALTVQAESDWVRIAVTDRGVGISREAMKRLFERFYRGDSARMLGQPGSGLGLALVKRVIEDHGGRVEVRSVPGEGSVFTVWLPASGAVEGVSAAADSEPG